MEGKGWTRFYFLTPPAALEKWGINRGLSASRSPLIWGHNYSGLRTVGVLLVVVVVAVVVVADAVAAASVVVRATAAVVVAINTTAAAALFLSGKENTFLNVYWPKHEFLQRGVINFLFPRRP